MFYVVYWLALAFGAAVTLAAFASLAGVFGRRRRARYGLLLLAAAWVPAALFFAFLFAIGARPAGWDDPAPAPRPGTYESRPAANPPAPGP